MDCRSVADRIDGLRDGTLAEAEASAVREHIAGCKACGELLSVAEELDREVRAAMRAVGPPADFAARTAGATGGIVMEPSYSRRVVWITLAAAAGIVLTMGLSLMLPDGAGPGGEGIRESAGYVMDAPAVVGSAFVVAGGRIFPYRGRTSVRIVWNVSQNAPELIVDAFPGRRWEVLP